MRVLSLILLASPFMDACGYGDMRSGCALVPATGATDSASAHLLYAYDRRRWVMHPFAEAMCAAFDPGGLAAAFREDHSLSLAPCSSGAGPGPAIGSFREALRANAIFLRRLPVPGVWYVAQANEGYHLREDGYGDFAWDLLKIDEQGRQHRGSGRSNEDYYAWDQPVLAPHAGVILSVVRAEPDGNPSRYLYGAGNAVYLRVHGRYLMAFLHLRAGSVPESLKPGAAIEQGALLGRVGNSGTQYPHLHLSMLWLDPSTGRSWGVPVEFGELYVKRPREASARPERFSSPARGSLIAAQPFEWQGKHPAGGWDALHEQGCP